MAYRARGGGRRSSYSRRAPARPRRAAARSGARRTGRVTRRAPAGQTLRIVVEGIPASNVSRDVLGVRKKIQRATL